MAETPNLDLEAITQKAAGPCTKAGQSILPITLSNVRFDAGQVRLFSTEALQIDAGHPTIILGPNGAGKSVLLRLMHGLIEPTVGHITYGDNVIHHQARKCQAMVFQKPILLRRSVLANLEFVLKRRGLTQAERNSITGPLLKAGALSEKTSQSARSLSGGEQQRLALLRALATRPEVLFLDEPTSSLDPGATAAIEEIIALAAKGGTKIVMVTHDMGQARRLGGEILFVYNGEVAEHRDATSFFKSPESDVARRFLDGQLVR